MESEPKRPIEEMLEASAKTRREAFGADPNMPNPMRARLHDEIARLQRAEPETSRSWLQMFWPRVAVAAAVATVLVVGPVMWWRGSNRGAFQIAERGPGEPSRMSDAAESADETFAKGPAANAIATPNVNLADNSQATLQVEQTPASVATESSNDTQLLADVSAAPPAVTKGLITKEDNEGETKTAAAPAAPAVASARARSDQSRQPAPASVAQKDQAGTAAGRAAAAEAVGATGTSRRFTQQMVGQLFQNNLPRQRANVLNNFEVQQQGNQIRLVDSDGSTYTGQLEATEMRGERAAKQSYTAGGEESKSEEPATRFRATGYNVSLRKSLVFEGSYSQTEPQSKSPNESAKTEAKADEAARIVGTARVPGEPPMEVDARPVPVERIER